MSRTRWVAILGVVSTLGLSAPALAQVREAVPCQTPTVVEQGYYYDERAAEAAAAQARLVAERERARYWREQELARRRLWWARSHRRHHRFVPYFVPSYGRYYR